MQLRIASEMTSIIEFPSGELLKKIERERSSKLGVLGNPELAIVGVDRWLAPVPKGEQPAYYSVSKLCRDCTDNLSLLPLCFFEERNLAEAYIREVSDNFIISLPDFLVEELVERHQDLVPF